MRTKLIVVGLSGLIGLAAVGAWPQGADEGSPAPAARTAGRSAPSQAEDTRRLEGSIEALRAEVEALAEAPAPRNPAPEPEPAPEPPTPEESEALVAGLSVDLDAMIAEEEPDAEWAGAMQQRIEAFFQPDALPGAHVQATDCRATMCRVDVRLDDAAAREQLARVSSKLLDPGAEIFGFVEHPDDLEISLYLSREGMPLPPL